MVSARAFGVSRPRPACGHLLWPAHQTRHVITPGFLLAPAHALRLGRTVRRTVRRIRGVVAAIKPSASKRKSAPLVPSTGESGTPGSTPEHAPFRFHIPHPRRFGRHLAAGCLVRSGSWDGFASWPGPWSAILPRPRRDSSPDAMPKPSSGRCRNTMAWTDRHWPSAEIPTSLAPSLPGSAAATAKSRSVSSPPNLACLVPTASPT